MKKTISLLSVLSLCFAYAGHDTGLACEHEHEHKHEHERGHGYPTCLGGDVMLLEVSEKVQKALGLATVRSERRRLDGSRFFAGRYELAPEARITVGSPVAGRLRLVVRPLDRIAKGDVLFTVESAELVAQEKEIAQLERRLAVYRELKTANAALENELAVKKAAVAAQVSGNEVKDGVVTVRAPAAGSVESLTVSDGAWLVTGAEVVRLIRPDALRLKALVAASEADQLTDGQACVVEGTEGEIRLGVGDGAGLVPVYAVFPKGAPRRRAGVRARLECVTDAHAPEVRVVPNGAVVRLGLKPAVFVRDRSDDDRFVAVPVVPGVSKGGWTAVEGLPDGDVEVVVAGAYELRIAVMSKESGVKTTGHFHADGQFHEGEDE